MARGNIPVGLFSASYPSDCTYELNSSLIRRPVIRYIGLLLWFGHVVYSFFLSKIYGISGVPFLIIIVSLWAIVFTFQLLPPGTVKIRHKNYDIKTIAAVVVACAAIIGVIFKAIDMLVSN